METTQGSRLNEANFPLGKTDGPNLDLDVCYSDRLLYVAFLDLCKTIHDISQQRDKEATSVLIPISSYQIVLSSSGLNKF